MFSLWIYAITSLFTLALASIFYVVSGEYAGLYISLILIGLSPILFPIIRAMRSDMVLPRPLFTKYGLISLVIIFITSFVILTFTDWDRFTSITIILLMTSIAYRIDGRVYYLVSLMCLVTIILTLLFHKRALAESISIILYILLVIGVLTDVISPFLDRWSEGSTRISRILEKFIDEYICMLRSYSEIGVFIMSIFLIVLIVGYKTLWMYSWDMLIGYSLLLITFLSILALISSTPYTFMRLIELECSFIPKFFREKYRYILLILYMLIIAFMVEYVYLRNIPVVINIIGMIFFVFLGMMIFYYREMLLRGCSRFFDILSD